MKIPDLRGNRIKFFSQLPNYLRFLTYEGLEKCGK